MRVSGEIIIKRIKANFISRWRVSAVVGGFVKQIFKNNGLILGFFTGGNYAEF